MTLLIKSVGNILLPPLQKQLIKFRKIFKKETVELEKSFRCVIVLGCRGKTEHKRSTMIKKITIKSKILQDILTKLENSIGSITANYILDEKQLFHFSLRRTSLQLLLLLLLVVVVCYTQILSHHVGGKDEDSLVFSTRPLWIVQQIGVIFPKVPHIIPCQQQKQQQRLSQK